MTKKNKEVVKCTISEILVLMLPLILVLLIWTWLRFIEITFEKQNKINKQESKINLEIAKQKQERIDLREYIINLDLETDNSITKFVNNKVHYNKLWYVPENLVSVWWKYIVDWKWWYIKVSKTLKENLDKLSEQFYLDTNNNIVVVSWYRSYNYQKWIKDRGCPDNLCAKAWYSEHQSGLTIDIYSASSEKNWANNNNLKKYFSWFKDNAYKYGFHNTYQKWLEIDWYEIEPWHWRYLWNKFAKYLHDEDITIAEFYNKKNIK
jgi:D-alanyl-D-alanine carboxypeptidase